MRSPGFEPGLSGWEPEVLTKLDYDRTETSGNQHIHDLLIALRGSGSDEDTVTCIGYKLNDINNETNINEPSTVALWIAQLKAKDKTGKRTGKPLTNATKTSPKKAVWRS